MLITACLHDCGESPDEKLTQLIGHIAGSHYIYYTQGMTSDSASAVHVYTAISLAELYCSIIVCV